MMIRCTNTKYHLGSPKLKRRQNYKSLDDMSEDKMPPKMRKRWMHRSFDALKAVNSGHGDATDVEGTFFNSYYHANPCNNVDSTLVEVPPPKLPSTPKMRQCQRRWILRRSPPTSIPAPFIPTRLGIISVAQARLHQSRVHRCSSAGYHHSRG
jgi:hypothetical protein